MVVSFDVIPEISTGRVLYMSARLGKDPLLEFEKFDAKEFPKLHHVNERQIIYASIAGMGKRGAREYYFRAEGAAFALPGKVDEEVMEANPDDFGLRLYCGLLKTDLSFF